MNCYNQNKTDDWLIIFDIEIYWNIYNSHTQINCLSIQQIFLEYYLYLAGTMPDATSILQVKTRSAVHWSFNYKTNDDQKFCSLTQTYICTFFFQNKNSTHQLKIFVPVEGNQYSGMLTLKSTKILPLLPSSFFQLHLNSV